MVVKGANPNGPLAPGTKRCMDTRDFLGDLLLSRAGWLAAPEHMCTVVEGSVGPEEVNRRFEELVGGSWETSRVTQASFWWSVMRSSWWRRW